MIADHGHKIIRKRYSPEFRERTVRLLLEHRPEYASEVAALRAFAEKVWCPPDSLRVWARQAQRDVGERPGPTRAEKARMENGGAKLCHGSGVMVALRAA